MEKDSDARMHRVSTINTCNFTTKIFFANSIMKFWLFTNQTKNLINNNSNNNNNNKTKQNKAKI